ncbi:MAG: DNA polymerase beta superfamily protein [Bacteroidota bacterium]
MTIPTQITERINVHLNTIEQQNDVTVLFAVEAGSHIWGLESADSDYDVRFVFCRPRASYLSIDLDEKRDVIQQTIDDTFEFHGWDIRKALRLFKDSNPSIIEWLQSGIVYREQSSFARHLRKLLPDFYSQKPSFFHYKHMAERNVREHLTGEVVRQKKYLYVVRPLLATMWIRKSADPVPLEFRQLLRMTLSPGKTCDAVERLIAAKQAGDLLDRGPRIEELSHFIDQEMKALAIPPQLPERNPPSVERLNNLFRATLGEIFPE